MSTRNLQCLNSYALYFLLVLNCLSIRSCRAQNNKPACLPSSCGNIASISYPFRLKTDPKHCGKPGYELDCKNNQTIITFKSKSFDVESINYSNYTIRMVDPGLIQESNFCSYPNFSLLFNDIPYDFWTYKPGKVVNDFIALNSYVVFVNCLNAVNSPKYIRLNDTSCGRDSSGSSDRYMTISVGDYEPSLKDLAASCKADKVAWFSQMGPPIVPVNASWDGIRRSLAYGFELSWHNVLCAVCDEFVSTCIIRDNEVTCKKYCYEDTPYAEKSFGCKLEFWSPAIAVGIGGIVVVLVLRSLIGLCCLAVLIPRQRKKLRLWQQTNHTGDPIFRSEGNA